MFSNVVPNYLIGLREGLEAALQFTAASLSLAAQELFAGLLSIVAVGFVTWMVFWMRRTARTLRFELHDRLDTALALGSGALALTAFLAVGREGLETAVFLWSAVQATGGSLVGPLAGAVGGLGTAILLAWLLYRRAITINLSRFFTVTGGALIVVAAGVLAYGVHDLQEARLLPGLDHLAFDVSAAVPATSWYGTLLKGIFNFSPAMTWLEVTVYVAYLAPTLALFA